MDCDKKMKAPKKMARIDSKCELYKSTPFEDPERQFRLLRLSKIDHQGQPSYLLSLWPLHDHPDFRAISYTWGDADKSVALRVDSTVQLITPNSSYALWQASQHHPDSYIWMDTICINQDDNEEKASQVAIMGTIYAEARQVLACIGPAYAATQNFPSFAPVIAVTATGLDGLLSDSEQLVEFIRDINIAIDLWRVWGLDQDVKVVRQLCEHFLGFCRRPYFRRLWIVQELFEGGDETYLLAGREMIRFSDARLLSLAIGYCFTGEPFLGVSQRGDEGNAFDELYSAFHTRRDFDEGIAIYAGLLCHDSRDRIYGTSRITNWEDEPPPQPNYNISTFELALLLYDKCRAAGFYSATVGSNIVKALEIGIDDQQVQTWIRGRSEHCLHSSPDPKLWDQEVDHAFPLYSDHEGRLVVASGRRRRGPNIYIDYKAEYSTKQLPGSPKTVFDALEPLCLVTKETQAGDFVVMLGKFDLVLRAYEGATTFHILGTTKFLKHAHRAHVQGNIARPLCDCVEQPKGEDFGLHKVFSIEFEAAIEDIICANAATISAAETSATSILSFPTGDLSAWLHVSKDADEMWSDEPLGCISYSTLLHHMDFHTRFDSFGGPTSMLEVGDYMYLSNRPCIITAMSSKDDRLRVVGLDLFTGEDHVDFFREQKPDHKIPRPFYDDYVLEGVRGGTFARLLHADGSIRDDMVIPKDKRLRSSILHGVDECRGSRATVLRVGEEEAIVAVRSSEIESQI